MRFSTPDYIHLLNAPFAIDCLVETNINWFSSSNTLTIGPHLNLLVENAWEKRFDDPLKSYSNHLACIGWAAG